MRPLVLTAEDGMTYYFAGTFRLVHDEKRAIVTQHGEMYRFNLSVANKQAIEKWAS